MDVPRSKPGWGDLVQLCGTASGSPYIILKRTGASKVPPPPVLFQIDELCVLEGLGDNRSLYPTEEGPTSKEGGVEATEASGQRQHREQEWPRSVEDPLPLRLIRNVR